MEFEEWLCYIEAISLNSRQQTICLLNLIVSKLDLTKNEDFLRAEKAIKATLTDDALMDGDLDHDQERAIWLESKHSQSYVLMKLQKAFAVRQFKK